MVQHTEFSNDHYTGPVFGPSTDDCDYIELFVSKCALYPEATEVDIRGWIVDDNANNFNSGGDCVGNFLTSAGHLRFADNPTWESVPVGSIIVLYNTVDNASCFNFTADLTGSGGVYYIPVGSTGLMEASSNAPTSSSCDYCTASYASYNPWWGIVTDTDRDAVQVRCPGCGEGDGGPAFYQGLSWGLTDMGPIAPGSNDLGGAHMHMGGRGRTFILDTDDVEDIKAGLGWTSTTAVASRPTAGSVSAGLRAALLGSPLPCCGNFEPPVVAEKQQYRFGFNGKENDNEVFGAVGTFQDYGMRAYDIRVGRFFSVDPIAVDYPMLTPYQFASNTPIQATDLDGLEAAYVIAEARVAVPVIAMVGLTGSAFAGIALDVHGNLGAIYGASGGVSGGAGAFGGIAIGMNPDAERITDLAGWGANTGFIIAAGSGVSMEFNVAFKNDKDGNADLKQEGRIGGNVGTPVGGGIGGAGYGEVSYTWVDVAGNVKDGINELYDNFQKGMEDVGIDINQVGFTRDNFGSAINELQNMIDNSAKPEKN